MCIYVHVCLCPSTGETGEKLVLVGNLLADVGKCILHTKIV